MTRHLRLLPPPVEPARAETFEDLWWQIADGNLSAVDLRLACRAEEYADVPLTQQ